MTTTSRPSARTRLWRIAAGTGRVIADTFARFNGNDGFAIASHVALHALLTMFPFLIFVTALAGFLDLTEQAGEIVELLFETWPEDIAAPIAEEVNDVTSVRRPDLLTIGILLAFWLASNGVEALRVGLNRAYGVHDTRGFIFQRLQSLLFVTVGAAALIVFGGFILFWDYLVDHAGWLHDVLGEGVFVRYLATGLVLMLALIIAHRWLPAGRRRIREVLPGVTVTMIVWILGGALFAYYLHYFSIYANTYAGLAAFMTALIFLYLVSVVMLLGASLNAAIRTMRDRAAAELSGRGERDDQSIG